VVRGGAEQAQRAVAAPAGAFRGRRRELYGKALSIAAEQEAKLWELRAAASLARLRRDQGRDAEALDLLAPVYGWCTEGFNTLDLKEAKSLRRKSGASDASAIVADPATGRPVAALHIGEERPLCA
jgi:predicted ATPase